MSDLLQEAADVVTREVQECVMRACVGCERLAPYAVVLGMLQAALLGTAAALDAASGMTGDELRDAALAAVGQEKCDEVLRRLDEHRALRDLGESMRPNETRPPDDNRPGASTRWEDDL